MERDKFPITNLRSSQIEAVGVVLTNMLLSNSQLAIGYRKHLAEKVNAEKGGYDNE